MRARVDTRAPESFLQAQAQRTSDTPLARLVPPPRTRLTRPQLSRFLAAPGPHATEPTPDRDAAILDAIATRSARSVQSEQLFGELPDAAQPQPRLQQRRASGESV